MKRIALILVLIISALPLAAQQEGLTLQECLESASENSPLLKNSSLDVLSAKAQRTEAALEYLPRVGITSFGYRAIHPLLEVTMMDVMGSSPLGPVAMDAGINPAFSTLKWGYGVTATVLQPIYAGGRIIAGNRLAKIGLEAANLKDSMSRREVRDSVEFKYWRIVGLQEKQKTLSQTLSLLDTLDKDLRSALAAGLATEPQMMDLSHKRSTLKSGIRRLERSLALLKMDLLETAGIPYQVLSLGDIYLADELSEVPSPEEVHAGGKDVYQREESRLLQLQVEAKVQEKRMAVGELLPQVTIGGGYGYSQLMGPKRGKFNGLVFGMVKIPITDIPKAVYRARRYDYQVEKALADQEWLTSRLRLQDQLLFVEVETAWDNLQDAIEEEILAEDTLERLKIRYQAGSATMSELMQSSLALSAASEKLADRRIEYRLAVIRFQH